MKKILQEGTKVKAVWWSNEDVGDDGYNVDATGSYSHFKCESITVVYMNGAHCPLPWLEVLKADGSKVLLNVSAVREIIFPWVKPNEPDFSDAGEHFLNEADLEHERKNDGYNEQT